MRIEKDPSGSVADGDLEAIMPACPTVIASKHEVEILWPEVLDGEGDLQRLAPDELGLVGDKASPDPGAWGLVILEVGSEFAGNGRIIGLRLERHGRVGWNCGEGKRRQQYPQQDQGLLRPSLWTNPRRREILRKEFHGLPPLLPPA